MTRCALCKEIADGWYVVVSNTHASCIVNMHPVKDGHVMVLPKRHIESWDGLSLEEAYDVFCLVEQVSDALKEEFGHFPFITINPEHRRSQRHVHIHLIPSHNGTRELFSIAEKTPLVEEAPPERRRELRTRVSKHFKK